MQSWRVRDCANPHCVLRQYSHLNRRNIAMLNKIARFASNPAYYIDRLRNGGGVSAGYANDDVMAAIAADIEDEATLKKHVFTVSRDPMLFKKLLENETFTANRNRWLYNILLGAAEYGSGNPEIALYHFEKAVSLKSTTFAWHCIGRAYTAMDQDEAAMNALAQGLVKHPDNMLLAAERATAAFRLGRKDEANTIIKPALPSFDAEHENTLKLQAEIEKAMAENLMERDGDSDIYDDKFVTDLWWDYNFCFRRYNRFQEGSAHISHLIREHVGGLLAGRASDAPAVIDFGVMCGAPNYQLARRFPEKQHYGVDRQPLIKTLNDAMYAASNMTFHDGSILDFLDQHGGKLNNGLMFHARTSVCCYPAFLKDMYKKCHAAGIKHIVAIEFMGLSKITRQFHDYNDPDHLSLALRSIMFIHNHVKMLEDAGYKVVEEKRYSRLGLTIDMGLGESQAYLYAVRQD